MDASEQPLSVRVGHGPDGSITYEVDTPPEALPAVRQRDLKRAWYAAREAALSQQWGVVRGFRFDRPDGSHTDLALADRDARCWAGAVDRTVGIASGYGLSLCLRLLALVELLARARWALPLLRLEPDGADLHPALLRAAANVELNADARFDEASFRIRLAQYNSGFQLDGPPSARLSGARA